MSKIICGIQARLGSSRLPGKVLMNLGEKRILELVVERCKTSEEIDEVVIAIGDEKENKAIDWSGTTELWNQVILITMFGLPETVLSFPLKKSIEPSKNTEKEIQDTLRTTQERCL